MTNEQLSCIIVEVSKLFEKSQNPLHNIEHLHRVTKNAYAITAFLGNNDSIDINILTAICYLHDMTWIFYKQSIFSYMYEGIISQIPVIQILKKYMIPKNERSVILNAIRNHPHSFPFRILNKKQDLYTKILQDADTFDFFHQERIYFATQKLHGWKKNLSNTLISFGKDHISWFLNYPEYSVFHQKQNNFFRNSCVTSNATPCPG